MFSRFSTCFSSLALMKPKERGVVSNYLNRNDKIVRKLVELGITPGIPIALENKSSAFTITLGDRQLEIDRDLARWIYVRMT